MLFTAVLALAAVAQAAPASQAAPVSKAFSIPAVHNVNHVRNGTAAMLKAYRKWNLTPTKPVSESFLSELLAGVLSKRQDGSVTASPDENNVEYLVPVTIGGQELQLDFDTGSADLWVFSSLLDSSDQSGHNIFDPDQSETFQESDGSWSIQYADGSGASGSTGTDDVTVGGTSVSGQVIELATQVSSSFASGAGDGLLGLAFSSINTVYPEQALTFFDNAQADLDSPVFAAYLPREADGAYDFGAIDDSRFSGEIKYTDVDSSNGFWEFPSTSFKVGSTTGSMSGNTGIADTGTTLLLTTDTAVDAYYEQVDSAENSESDGGYVFDCDADLPDFAVKIGSTNYATVPGSLINFAPASESGKCFGGLQSVGGGSQNIYGDVFLNANYAIFDASGPSFGFAAY